jgi:hypothetical protein
LLCICVCHLGNLLSLVILGPIILQQLRTTKTMHYSAKLTREARNQDTGDVSDDDSISMLSDAAPPANEVADQPFRSPLASHPPSKCIALSRCARRPQLLSTDTTTSETTLVVRPRLFTAMSETTIYSHSPSWTDNTTPTPTHPPKCKQAASDLQVLDESPDEDIIAAPKKQYFRKPRHFREPWKSGALTRFPWRGIGALLVAFLRTSSPASHSSSDY